MFRNNAKDIYEQLIKFVLSKKPQSKSYTVQHSSVTKYEKLELATKLPEEIITFPNQGELNQMAGDTSNYTQLIQNLFKRIREPLQLYSYDLEQLDHYICQGQRHWYTKQNPNMPKISDLADMVDAISILIKITPALYDLHLEGLDADVEVINKIHLSISYLFMRFIQQIGEENLSLTGDVKKLFDQMLSLNMIKLPPKHEVNTMPIYTSVHNAKPEIVAAFLDAGLPLDIIEQHWVRDAIKKRQVGTLKLLVDAGIKFKVQPDHWVRDDNDQWGGCDFVKYVTVYDGTKKLLDECKDDKQKEQYRELLKIVETIDEPPAVPRGVVNKTDTTRVSEVASSMFYKANTGTPSNSSEMKDFIPITVFTV
ncbi:MAG: hypothetical protein ABI597_04670 [Gammaproteobacteria bacterium]